jgi:hypothetical protein
MSGREAVEAHEMAAVPQGLHEPSAAHPWTPRKRQGLNSRQKPDGAYLYL